MRYAALKRNDIANAPGISVSIYLQGCPHRCHNCFNPETWDFDRGYIFDENTMQSIIDALDAQGVQRSLCILGGEPLCKENTPLTWYIVQTVRTLRPHVPIYIWTGYYLKDLITRKDYQLQKILTTADYLIDGPFIEAEKDLTLEMRGSRNQSIINLQETKFDF